MPKFGWLPRDCWRIGKEFRFNSGSPFIQHNYLFFFIRHKFGPGQLKFTATGK